MYMDLLTIKLRLVSVHVFLCGDLSLNLIICNDRLTCLISSATWSCFEEQRFMPVDAAVFCVVIKSEISVARIFDTSECTMHLRLLLHNSLRFVRGTSVHLIILCLA